MQPGLHAGRPYSLPGTRPGHKTPLTRGPDPAARFVLHAEAQESGEQSAWSRQPSRWPGKPRLSQHLWCYGTGFYYQYYAANTYRDAIGAQHPAPRVAPIAGEPEHADAGGRAFGCGQHHHVRLVKAFRRRQKET
jgi:hypothetical protein